MMISNKNSISISYNGLLAVVMALLLTHCSAGIAAEHAFDNPTEDVSVRMRTFNKPRLQQLAEGENLIALDVSFSTVNDADLHFLKKIINIKKLNLMNTKITDGGVALTESVILGVPLALPV